MARKRQALTLELIKHRSKMDGDCWVFCTDSKVEHHRRYPQAKHKGERVQVRRLAYELAKGSAGDLRIVPCCGNPYCINPWHQQAMTESEKMKLHADRGAFSAPSRLRKIAEATRRAHAKLTMEQANEIRASDESGPVLALRYGINKSRVSAIRRGDAWRDYNSPFAALLAANDGRRQA